MKGTKLSLNAKDITKNHLNNLYLTYKHWCQNKFGITTPLEENVIYMYNSTLFFMLILM